MRRRGAGAEERQPGRHAANFYRQYAAETRQDGISAQADGGEKGDAKITRKSFLSSLHVIFAKLPHDVTNAFRVAWAWLVACFARAAAALASWRRGGRDDDAQHLDVLLACVDCGEAFSPWARWRTPCACCQNMFCGTCVSLKHKLHDGKDRGGHSRQVCSYCFFQLCARHCSARCCGTLRVGELRRFLSRKGLFGGSGTKGALEKSDLVRSVHAWATDLAAAETSELLGGDNGAGWA